MAKLKTDSPLSRRIVGAFFDFLDSVEPSPGVDLEGLEVARECLIEAFQLDLTSTTNDKPGLLIDFFRSLENSENEKIKVENSENEKIKIDTRDGATPVEAPILSDDRSADASHSEPIQGDDWTQPFCPMGVSKDELFGQFFAALEKIHFFKATPDGNDDPVQVDKATRLFHDALNEMQKAGCQSYNMNSLAETLKSQGNQAMQAKSYADAIELYSCAISLFESNAVYYCNRAAAYTQIQKYNEAIRDCLKSIEIDPSYSKAYSRLGIAYYAQGNYRDAIDKGFRNALQLDPHNEGVKENIQKAMQKLREEQQRFRWDQNMNFSGGGGHKSREFNTQIPTPPSMPFNMNGVPADIANMFMNMASQYAGGHTPEESRGEEGNTNGSNEPGIRLGGNINLNNLGESMPPELRGALNSVMGMFPGGGTAQDGSTQDTNATNGRSSTD